MSANKIKYVVAAVTLKNKQPEIPHKYEASDIAAECLGVFDTQEEQDACNKKYAPFLAGHFEFIDRGRVAVPQSKSLTDNETLELYMRSGIPMGSAPVKGAWPDEIPPWERGRSGFSENGSFRDDYAKSMWLLSAVFGRAYESKDEASVVYMLTNFYHRIPYYSRRQMRTVYYTYRYPVIPANILNWNPDETDIQKYFKDVAAKTERSVHKNKPTNDYTELREYFVPDGKTYKDLSVRERRALFDEGQYVLLTKSYKGDPPVSKPKRKKGGDGNAL